MTTTEPPVKKKNVQTTEKERRDGAIMGVWIFDFIFCPSIYLFRSFLVAWCGPVVSSLTEDMLTADKQQFHRQQAKRRKTLLETG